MVTIRTRTTRKQDVTLIQVKVTNTRATTQTVTIRSQLDGPVWPPRRNGMIIPEWTDETWAAEIAPGECRGFGFATPAKPVDAPIELVSASRSTGEKTDSKSVIASLEEWSPPSIVSAEDTE